MGPFLLPEPSFFWMHYFLLHFFFNRDHFFKIELFGRNSPQPHTTKDWEPCIIRGICVAHLDLKWLVISMYYHLQFHSPKPRVNMVWQGLHIYWCLFNCCPLWSIDVFLGIWLIFSLSASFLPWVVFWYCKVRDPLSSFSLISFPCL